MPIQRGNFVPPCIEMTYAALVYIDVHLLVCLVQVVVRNNVQRGLNSDFMYMHKAYL